VDPQTTQLLEALGYFKDWSNFLLVTTVAALGWVATKLALISVNKPVSRNALKATLVCFGASIVFAIFTLALIPIVAQNISSTDRSFYDVGASFNALYLWGPVMTLKLKYVCWWQHVLFLIGIVAFTVGSYAGAADVQTKKPAKGAHDMRVRPLRAGTSS
jgi:hypothetical protein